MHLLVGTASVPPALPLLSSLDAGVRGKTAYGSSVSILSELKPPDMCASIRTELVDRILHTRQQIMK